MSILTLGYPRFLGTGSVVCTPFDQLFGQCVPATPEAIAKGKIHTLVIWGGADISPSLYSTPPSKYTYARSGLSERDECEVELFMAAVEHGVPIIGVCRGAQLACALSGGKLVQHVDGHGGRHAMQLSDGRVLTTTSVHHQMMFPFELPEADWNLLAWSKEKLSARYVLTDDDIRTEIPVEPEVIWFPKTKALAIQGHPEFDHPSSPFVAYCLDLVKQHILRNHA